MRDLTSETAIGKRVKWISNFGSVGIGLLRDYEVKRSITKASQHSPANASLLMDQAILDLDQKKFFGESFIQMLFTVLENRDKVRFGSATAYRMIQSPELI